MARNFGQGEKTEERIIWLAKEKKLILEEIKGQHERNSTYKTSTMSKESQHKMQL